MNRDMLTRAGATSFDELWSLLETDKDKFVEKMRSEQKINDEKMRTNPWSVIGHPEYLMMQEVWTEYHKYDGKRAPPPSPTFENPHSGQFTLPPLFYHTQNSNSAQPALTKTKSNPTTVQWVQGNRIIMRPSDSNGR
jgi:hypothetical protein